MIPYPVMSPDIVHIGPLTIRWYGVMYLIGFASSFFLVKKQIRKRGLPFSNDFLESLYSYIIVGLVIGARLGYVIFYNLSASLRQPLEIFAVWHGGMSFHGGLIGSVISGIWYCKHSGADAWLVSDLVAATAPIGLGAGRLGNFINGELYGRVTSMPWGMIFPNGGPLPRHPSQLYEFFLEGGVLFVVLWIMKDRLHRRGVLLSLFIVLYGVIRFSVEFFREPDSQLGFILGPFSMGQVLSAIMVLGGLILYIVRQGRGKTGAVV
jgi:phosphatidylglycerol:prolipoprotein diacylglycerol transferase